MRDDKKPDTMSAAARNRLEPLFKRAENAARESRLPGWRNGPADAFRHIVASAEATRRYGAPLAKLLGEAHEFNNRRAGQPAQEAEMDRRNNDIGIGIGADAETFDEIIRRTRALIKDAATGAPLHSSETPVWLPEREWREDRVDRDRSNWPPIWTEGRDGVAERVLARPVEEWSPDDVRTVQGSGLYLNDGRARDSAFAKVRDWYAREKAPVGGIVAVRAYSRGDGTQVDAHSRAAPVTR